MNELLYELDLLEARERSERGSAYQRRKNTQRFEAELEDLLLDDYRSSENEFESLYEVDRRSSAYIKWIQRSLNLLIDAGLVVDGDNGRRTKAAVRNFQRGAGLSLDEKVGPNTERALIAAGASLPPSGGTTPTTIDGRTLRNNIVRIARQEWERWDRGRRKEGNATMRSTLRAYWQRGVGWVPGGSQWWSEHAWSAAFISWVMREAGAGSAFRYSARHTDYVGAAKRNRVANNNNPFKAYRISEVAPRVGDLVCKARSSSGVSYDNVDKGRFKSHCDIVVEVQSGQIKTIGGNVSNSVKQSTVRTDSSGHITQSGYYAVVRVGD